VADDRRAGLWRAAGLRAAGGLVAGRWWVAGGLADDRRAAGLWAYGLVT